MTIIAIISPLLLLSLFGYLIAKKQWLTDRQLSGLNKITFTIFIPAFLFYQMATADLTDQFSPLPIASFYLPVLVCFAIGFIANYLLHKDYQGQRGASAVFALASSYSNNIIVGLPLLLLVIGDKALPIIFLVVTFHSAMLFALTSGLATETSTNQSRKHWLAFIKQTLTNPLVCAILSGLVINISQLELPTLIARTLEALGQPAITLALIALGASIAKYDIRGERKFIALASTIKLILLPLLVYLTTQHLFNLDPLVVQVLVVLSACPTGVNAYLIAQVHGMHRKAVASTVVASTIASIFTLPLWLIWLDLH